MKNKMAKKICALCAAVMVLGAVAGCGGDKGTADTTTSAVQTQETETQQTETAVEATETVASTEAATTSSLEEQIKDEDSYLVLEGVGDGWAPTAMVLLNDGTFYCLVDYAGQAVVNFCQGEYVVNEDGSITATGALYTDSSKLVYEITCVEGTYTTTVDIPDTEVTVDLTGTIAE